MLKTAYSYRVHAVGNPTPIPVYADGYYHGTDEDGLGDRFEFHVGAKGTPQFRIVARFMRDKVVGIELHMN